MKWWYVVYDGNGKKFEKDYWFTETVAHSYAKKALRALQEIDKAKAAGKTDPKRFYA